MQISRLRNLIRFIESQKTDKDSLSNLIKNEFEMETDRKILYNKDFAIRFCTVSRAGSSLSNGVISLAALEKHDNIPFIVCFVSPSENIMLLANTSLLKRISHSSKELREDNIRGTFLGTDIMRELSGIENIPRNFSRLFRLHKETCFADNLKRLVKATQEINSNRKKFVFTTKGIKNIKNSPRRADSFIKSPWYEQLQNDLNLRLSQNMKHIIKANNISNNNIRSRVIEYLIVGEDSSLRNQLIASLNNSPQNIPSIKADRKLGDYTKNLGEFITATDVKTKVMSLESNPKGYNIDKMLKFLSQDDTVFMFYFIGLSPKEGTSSALVSMFDNALLSNYRISGHWSGRNSLGTFQLDGKAIRGVLEKHQNRIVIKQAQTFIKNAYDI